MAGLGVLSSPLTYTFHNGRVANVEGEGAAR
jgi:hypothetical protein